MRQRVVLHDIKFEMERIKSSKDPILSSCSSYLRYCAYTAQRIVRSLGCVVHRHRLSGIPEAYQRHICMSCGVFIKLRFYTNLSMRRRLSMCSTQLVQLYPKLSTISQRQ